MKGLHANLVLRMRYLNTVASKRSCSSGERFERERDAKQATTPPAAIARVQSFCPFISISRAQFSIGSVSFTFGITFRRTCYLIF